MAQQVTLSDVRRAERKLRRKERRIGRKWMRANFHRFSSVTEMKAAAAEELGPSIDPDFWNNLLDFLTKLFTFLMTLFA